MLRPLIVLLTLLGTLPAMAQDIDGEIQLGASFSGVVGWQGDVDIVEFDGIHGELTTLRVKAKGGSLLEPRLRVLDPQEQQVAEAVAENGKAVLKNLTLPATGRYRVLVDSADGSIGAFKLKTKGTLPAVVKHVAFDPASGKPGILELPFDAKPGMRMKAVVKAEPGSDDLPGDPALAGPAGAVDLAPYASGNAAKLVLKKVPLVDVGSYLLSVPTTTGAGVLVGSVIVTVSHGKKKPLVEHHKAKGFNFSPYLDGQDPNLGSQIGLQQLTDRMTIIAGDTEWIRTFGVDSGLEKAGAVAHQLGLKAAVGAWLGEDQAVNAQQVATLISLAQAGEVDIAVVGSEVLLREDLTKAQLLAHIQAVRAAIPPAIPVTTGEVYQTYLANPDLASAVDVLFVNYYPYWEGAPAADALKEVHCRHKGMQALAGGKDVWVSETGWPSAGNVIGAAVPSPENAAAVFLKTASWALINDVPYLYFEAFDESWKALYEGPQGAHWGVWDKNGALKPGMDAVFNGGVLVEDWELPVPGGPGTPELVLTQVPPVGSFENLKGQILHADPALHVVTVYIRVSGNWWMKPYELKPVTVPTCGGAWECDITTGGNDAQATEVAAFLLPVGIVPPVVLGAPSLPASLYQDAVAYVTAFK